MENLQEQINLKQADILAAKAYLYETDYHVIKATELKTDLDEEISSKRAESRELINTRESEIAELKIQLDAQVDEHNVIPN